MALSPCDHDGHRYPGPAQSVYLALLDGGSSWRRKFRLCPRHFSMFEDTLRADFAAAGDELRDDQEPKCPQCHGRPELGNAAAFATVYATGLDRADYWSPVCEEHVFDLRVRWGMDPQPPFEAPSRG